MGDERQEANLARRKSGKPMKLEPQLGQPAVALLISQGKYVVLYDGNGLQTSDSDAPGEKSTWYNFNITTVAGKAMGYYHVHPKRSGGYASGNLRMNDSSSFGSYNVGRAWDWRNLCKALEKDLV
jgi:hypothetical protein